MLTLPINCSAPCYQFRKTPDPLDWRIVVEDDYLDTEQSEYLFNYFTNGWINEDGEPEAHEFNWLPWTFCDVVSDDEADMMPTLKSNWQLSHMFYRNADRVDPDWESNYSWLMQPIVDKIAPDYLYKIKANLNPYQGEEIITHGFHHDFQRSGFTSIIYLNDCNGKTILKTPDKMVEIESKRGRMITFDNRIAHTGTTSTDTRVRAVINLNYYIHDKSKVYDRV
jgi:hypothetical protein